MRRPPHPPGFTLLETLVALVVLGTAVLVVLQLFSGVAASTHRHRAHAEAMALAQSEMERLLAQGPEDVLGSDGRDGAFPAPFAGYRYEVGARRLVERELVELQLRVTWGDDGGGGIVLATRIPAAAGTVAF